MQILYFCDVINSRRMANTDEYDKQNAFRDETSSC